MSLETLFEAGDEECQRCGVMQGLYQRQNTQFADEALNWVVLYEQLENAKFDLKEAQKAEREVRQQYHGEANHHTRTFNRLADVENELIYARDSADIYRQRHSMVSSELTKTVMLLNRATNACEHLVRIFEESGNEILAQQAKQIIQECNTQS